MPLSPTGSSGRMMPVKAAALGITVLGSAAASTCAATGIAPQTTANDRWAVVNADGSLARGKGAVAAVRIPPPLGPFYLVSFDQNVRNCVHIATLGLPGPGAAPVGIVSVAPGLNSNPKQISVHTRTQNGVRASLGFHVYIGCGATQPASTRLVTAGVEPQVVRGDAWAVVNADGTLVRGRRVIGVSNAVQANYKVSFDRIVRNCVFVTAPGQTGLVSASNGGDNRVHVVTTTGTGHLTNLPFHLLVGCGSAPGDRSAVVTGAGVIRARGLLAKTSVATGQYRLRFDRDISNCVYVASHGSGVVGSFIGGLTAVTGTNNPTAIKVAMRNEKGEPFNEGIHVIVGCE